MCRSDDPSSGLGDTSGDVVGFRVFGLFSVISSIWTFGAACSLMNAKIPVIFAGRRYCLAIEFVHLIVCFDICIFLFSLI